METIWQKFAVYFLYGLVRLRFSGNRNTTKCKNK